jgi:hypothetical protein
MATTTNYGWTTPNDTDLVKDGAAAIRTLGSSVDTTTKALNPSTTLGDIEYRSATANTNTRLGIGSTGDILTVTGGVPVWAAPAASGGMTLISETVASALTSLSLTSIPGTYKQLMLVWSGIYHSTTGGQFGLRFNNNSSGTAYARQIVRFNNATVDCSGFSADNEAAGSVSQTFGNSIGTSSTNLTVAVKGTLLIDNYASSTKLKFYKQENSYSLSGGDIRIGRVDGVFNSTTAITSIDIYDANGSGNFSNITNTSIRLYGIS